MGFKQRLKHGFFSSPSRSGRIWGSHSLRITDIPVNITARTCRRPFLHLALTFRMRPSKPSPRGA